MDFSFFVLLTGKNLIFRIFHARTSHLKEKNSRYIFCSHKAWPMFFSLCK